MNAITKHVFILLVMSDVKFTMKYLAIILTFLISAPILSGQGEWARFDPIASVRDNDPGKLAREITKPFEKDEDKVAAIYYWITHNIKYDYKLFEKTKKNKSKDKKITKKKLKEKNEKEVSKTLSSKKGICQQYSLVFQAMCEGIGIQSIVVTGYAKDASKVSGLGEKHAWNAVYVGENWYLVDATFGSGYLDDDKKFVFLFNPTYFFSNPDAFKMNHHPKQERYQYTTAPISKEEYKANPGIGIGYFQNGIGNLYPNMGKVTIAKGTQFEISFQSDEELKELNIGNIKRATEIDAQYSESGGNYKISVNTADMKSGTYAIQNGKVLLFTYRLNIN